jgi:hypothetical protein
MRFHVGHGDQSGALEGPFVRLAGTDLFMIGKRCIGVDLGPGRDGEQGEASDDGEGRL